MEQAAEERRWGAPARRLLLPTERSDLSVTWHRHHDRFTLSLWRDEECVGSAVLSTSEAATLASHIVTQLGERALWGPRLVVSKSAPRWSPQRAAAMLLRRLRFARPHGRPSRG